MNRGQPLSAGFRNDRQAAVRLLPPVARTGGGLCVPCLDSAR